jgi:hypothetical protein
MIIYQVLGLDRLLAGRQEAADRESGLKALPF